MDERSISTKSIGKEMIIFWVNNINNNIASDAITAGITGFTIEKVTKDRVIINTKTDEKEIRKDAIETPLYPYHMIKIGEITHVKTVHKIIK